MIGWFHRKQQGAVTRRRVALPVCHDRAECGAMGASRPTVGCEPSGAMGASRPTMGSRRGVTLVELMIAMLILAIVCISWLQIIGIQSARKEARRREAVERLAGMMDAFMYNHRKGQDEFSTGVNPGYYYYMELDENNKTVRFISAKKDDAVRALFENDVSPIGYQLQVVEKKDLPDNNRFSGFEANGTRTSPLWLVGRLYNHNGSSSEAGKPFFTLPVFLNLAPSGR